MRPDDIQKLLGGYATGTLTDAEQQALFAAALEDQELFDTLAREQSLRELLRDPAAKAELLASLDERPKRWLWWWRPAAALAMAGIAAIAVVIVRQRAPQPPAAIVAEVRSPAAGVGRALASAPSAAATRAGAEATEGIQRSAAGSRAVPRPADAVTLAEAPKIAQPVHWRRYWGGWAESSAGVPPAPAAAPLSFTSAPERRGRCGESVGRAPSDLPRARCSSERSPRGRAFRRRRACRRASRNRSDFATRVLRKEGGDFVAADPDALKPGDEVELRFTANANGYLSLDGADACRADRDAAVHHGAARSSGTR